MTDSNRLRLTTVVETSLGVTPNTPRMRILRNTGEALQYTPQFVQSAELRPDRMNSDPIKVNEQNQGTINFELSYPVASSPLSAFFQSALFGAWLNTPTFDNDGTADSVITDAGTVANTYAVVSGGAAVKAGHLVRATGFANAANNQIFKAASSSATTIVGTALTLTAEAVPAAAAKLKVVGFQGASADITATATGLGSTALDFTTLGLAVGQWIKIGGTAAGVRFATAALNAWARITAIATNALTLDNLPVGWATDTGTGKTINVWFGDEIKNGTAVSSLTIERGFMGQAVPTYIVQRGMVVGQAALNFNTEQVISGTFTMEGLNGAQSTTSLSATPDAETTNRIMAANVNVGRIAESGVPVSSPNWVRSLTLNINNNLRMRTGLGVVGAVDIGSGENAVDVKMETYFGDNTLLAKLLAGTVGNVNCRTAKDNQAIIVALPRLTFTGGSPSAGAKNQDVTLPLAGMVSKDTLTGAQIIVDRLDYYED